MFAVMLQYVSVTSALVFVSDRETWPLWSVVYVSRLHCLLPAVAYSDTKVPEQIDTLALLLIWVLSVK